MKVALHLVTWNGLRYLPELFASLRSQTFSDVHLRVLDNASTDGTSAWLHEHVRTFFPHAELFFEKTNLGFAGGHNELFDKIMNEEFVLLVNQDLLLQSHYLAELVAVLEMYPNTAITAGLLLQMGSNPLRIDSAGLRVHRTRKVDEISAGDLVPIASPEIKKVFGVSGTLPLIRTSALKMIAVDGEYFDRDFDSYKEDVDLAFRFQSAGFDAMIVPTATAFHDRSVSAFTDRGIRSLRNRKNSYRNHLCMLVKNEYGENFARDFFWIFGFELGKLFFLLLTEPQVLTAWVDFFRLLPTMRAKRRAITATRRRTATELRTWYV